MSRRFKLVPTLLGIFGLLMSLVPGMRGPAAMAAGANTALLGSTAEQAAGADFFTFFHLGEVSRTQDDQHRTVITYKPDKGSKFYALTTVTVTLGPDRRVAAIDMALARSFVDDVNNGVYARDIAKSLLLDSLPPADREAVVGLAHEIEYRVGAAGHTLILRYGGHIPVLPARPTAAYLVYIGKKAEFSQPFGHSELRIENRKVSGVDSLVISVGGRL